MNAIVGFLYAGGVLAVVGAGFAAIVGLAPLRARFFGVAVVLTVAALATPVAWSLVASGVGTALDAIERGALSLGGVPAWVPMLLVLGYGTAAVALVLRPRLPALRCEHEAEQERARSRQRRRMPPRGEEI